MEITKLMIEKELGYEINKFKLEPLYVKGECLGLKVLVEPKNKIEFINTTITINKSGSSFDVDENLTQKSNSCNTDNWFKTEQIETFVGEMNNGGGRKKLVVLHQCGDDKQSLIGQLKTMISGLENNFDGFSS